MEKEKFAILKMIECRTLLRPEDSFYLQLLMLGNIRISDWLVSGI